MRKYFQREEKLDSALMELQMAGYVRKIEPPRIEGAGRPYLPSLELHPSLLNKDGAETEPEKDSMQ